MALFNGLIPNFETYLLHIKLFVGDWSAISPFLGRYKWEILASSPARCARQASKTTLRGVCNTIHHTATHCNNTLQHTATHCNNTCADVCAHAHTSLTSKTTFNGVNVTVLHSLDFFSFFRVASALHSLNVRSSTANRKSIKDPIKRRSSFLEM